MQRAIKRSTSLAALLMGPLRAGSPGIGSLPLRPRPIRRPKQVRGSCTSSTVTGTASDPMAGARGGATRKTDEAGREGDDALDSAAMQEAVTTCESPGGSPMAQAAESGAAAGGRSQAPQVASITPANSGKCENSFILGETFHRPSSSPSSPNLPLASTMKPLFDLYGRFRAGPPAQNAPVEEDRRFLGGDGESTCPGKMQPRDPVATHLGPCRELDVLLGPEMLLIGDFDGICPGMTQQLLRPRAPLLARRPS
mmetsp:Transcript_111053/g.313223  ORF Transcript_111053/g.313223 Transcript_111053/m.313223 type:complete len:254 (+) Transcript_111053:382-1143(+)